MYKIWFSFISWLFFISILIIYKSARLKIINEDIINTLFNKGTKVIFTFFHGDYLFLFPHFRGRNASVFTTISQRGDYLSEIIRRFGYRPYKIPNRGGERAIRTMIRAVNDGHHAAIVVDGPMGPYHKVKQGAIIVAMKTSGVIVPIGLASKWGIVMKRRWDRYTIPLPFTRAVIMIGEPIHVPMRLGEDEIEIYRRKLEERLIQLNNDAKFEIGN